MVAFTSQGVTAWITMLVFLWLVVFEFGGVLLFFGVCLFA